MLKLYCSISPLNVAQRGCSRLSNGFFALPAVSRCRRSVLVLSVSVCVSVCDHVLKIFEHSILQAAWGNLAKFKTRIQFWIQWLVFEVKRLKVKETQRDSKYYQKLLVKNAIFWLRHTEFAVNDHLVKSMWEYVVKLSITGLYWRWINLTFFREILRFMLKPNYYYGICTFPVFVIFFFLQLDQSFSEYGRQYSSFVVVSVVEIDVNLHSPRNTEPR